MSALKQHIAELKKLLRLLEDDLSLYVDRAALKEKQLQLQSIEQNINNLKKKEIPIPEQLRKLKLSLLSEIDDWRIAQSVKPEAIKLCKAFIAKNKETRISKKEMNPVGQFSLFNPEEIINQKKK